MRKTFDERAEAPGKPAFDDGYLPCRQCRSPTLLAMLGQHGGRCLRCFEGYCREGECGAGSFRTLTNADKVAVLQRMRDVTRGFAARNAEDPKRWARVLLERADSGVPVPSSSLAMARRALRTYVGTEPESDTGALAADTQRRVDAFIRDEYVPGL
jgi:hypothetical protein